MDPNNIQNQQCHVCHHLGETQCKYTSHKKYRNQKGNQSFRVGDLAESTHKQPTFLHNFKQEKFTFQFPSLIPSLNLSATQSLQQSPNKTFQRSLIEKVLQDQTPFKVMTLEAAESVSQPQGKLQVKTQSFQQGFVQKKTPSSFLRHHKVLKPEQYLLKKPIQQSENKPYKRESSVKKQFATNFTGQSGTVGLHTVKFNETNNFNEKRSKYHFDYSRKQFPENYFYQLNHPKPQTNQKSIESSFHVEDHKFTSQTSEMIISRIKNEKQRSSYNYYKTNVFKDVSGGEKADGKAEEILRNEPTQTTQFRYDGEKVLSNTSQSKNTHQPTPNVTFNLPKQLPINLPPSNSIYTPSSYNPIRQEPHNPPPSINNNQKLSASTNYQNYLQSRIQEQNALNQQPNLPIETKRPSFRQFQQEKLFYPIYPVYEVVYELVRVVPRSVG